MSSVTFDCPNCGDGKFHIVEGEIEIIPECIECGDRNHVYELDRNTSETNGGQA